jgi:hypothetical protein
MAARLLVQLKVLEREFLETLYKSISYLYRRVFVIRQCKLQPWTPYLLLSLNDLLT